MKTPMSKMLLCVGIFFAIIFGWYGVKKAMFLWFISHYKPPAATISATEAKTKKWESYLSAIGSVSAINGVDLSSQVMGIVKEIHFNSGQMVKQGDAILKLDANIQEAELKRNQARLQLAKVNYEREKSLVDKKASSKAKLDAQYAELLQAEAGVEAAQAQIKERIISAPFAGRLGIRQINLGQYISPGAPIVTLQSLDPLYVLFSLPEQQLASIHLDQAVDVTVNMGQQKTIRGKITAINAKVDQMTRNVLVQATIPNENLALYPGMYAQLKIWLTAQNDTIVVPQTAIAYSLSGDFIYVVKKQQQAKESAQQAYRQYVKIGERRDNEVTILDGLKPGDLIVTSGQLKLQNGSSVVINNSVDLS